MEPLTVAMDQTNVIKIQQKNEHLRYLHSMATTIINMQRSTHEGNTSEAEKRSTLLKLKIRKQAVHDQMEQVQRDLTNLRSREIEHILTNEQATILNRRFDQYSTDIMEITFKINAMKSEIIEALMEPNADRMLTHNRDIIQMSNGLTDRIETEFNRLKISSNMLIQTKKFVLRCVLPPQDVTFARANVISLLNVDEMFRRTIASYVNVYTTAETILRELKAIP